MRRTDAATHLIAFLLFLAFVAYAGIYAFRALRASTVTAEAVGAEFSLSAPASGLVVREETVLSSGGRSVDVLAEEGEKLAAFSAVASAANNPQGVARSARRRELEREIARASAILDSLRAADADRGASGSARALAAAVARHDTQALDPSAAVLEALLLGANASVSETRLDALEKELQSLRNGASPDAETLYTLSSGVFSSVVDGWESVGPGDLHDPTPASVNALSGSRRTPDPAAYGKLVTDYRWYFAAVMAEEDAAGLEPGQRATLSFGRQYPEDIPAAVESVSAPEGGERAVVFRCDTALADTLSLRQATAEVSFGHVSGVRIPSAALRLDEETDETYVWAVSAMILERRSVEAVYLGEDFVLVRRGTDSGALRPGSVVVVRGEELYEGKVLD